MTLRTEKGVRHLDSGSNWSISDTSKNTNTWKFYADFVREEEEEEVQHDHKSTFHTILNPLISACNARLLIAVLDLVALIATHAAETAMTGEFMRIERY